jgi:hypothetical protein
MMTQTSVTLFLPLLLQIVHRVPPLVINFLSIVISMGWTTATFTVSDLQEARIMFSRIIEEWVAERAGIAAAAGQHARRLESFNLIPVPGHHGTGRSAPGPPMTLGNTAAVRVWLHRVIARLVSIRSSLIPPRARLYGALVLFDRSHSTHRHHVVLSLRDVAAQL